MQKISDFYCMLKFESLSSKATKTIHIMIIIINNNIS